MLKSNQQTSPPEEGARRRSNSNGFNFLGEIKKSGRSSSSSSRTKQQQNVEDVSVLSANSEGKRLEAAGATPYLKKMHRSSSMPLVANFTGLTESMSDGSSGFDMTRGANAALFRDRDPPSNTHSNASEVEIQFQTDGGDSSEEDQTWSAPFIAAARAVEKHQQQLLQRHHIQAGYTFENESVVDIEKIWTDSEYASRMINQLSTPEKRLILETMPPPPPPTTAPPAPVAQYSPSSQLMTASEEQSLIQIASSPTARSMSSDTTSSEGVRSDRHALLDEDETTTLAGGDDYTFDGEETYDGFDSLDDGDTYGDETITLDEDDDGEDTLAGETLLDDRTYQEGRRGSVGFFETILEDLADIDHIENLGSFFLSGCVAANSSKQDGGAIDDDDDNTYLEAEATNQRIGTWVGFGGGGTEIRKHDDTIDVPSMAPTESLETINTEEWSLLSRLKQSLSINDEAAPAQAPAPANENQNLSFLDPFFSCKW